jgi:ribosomal protein S18 acetylase RimI-like enzyme
MLSLVDRLSKLRDAECVIQTQVCFRPAAAADDGAMRDFLLGLSSTAQYHRFFTGLGSVSPSLVRDLIAVTPAQRVLLATEGVEVVGHAMATVNPDGLLELGVVVADRHRRRGIATGLVRRLIERAALAGVAELRLDVLCENQVVVDWLRRGLPGIRFERDGFSLTGFAPLRLDVFAAA